MGSITTEADGACASIRFLKKLDLYNHEKPFQGFFDIPPDAPDQRQNNLEFEDKEIIFNDIRGRESSYTLDTHGFMVRRQSLHLNLDLFSSHESVEAHYLPEIEKLLKQEIEGIDRVFFFDWRLRYAKPESRQSRADVDMPSHWDLNNWTHWLQPSPQVHVDQSPSAVLHRVQLQLGQDAESLLRGRVRVINVWRPILYEVEDYPLAVCDGKTMKDIDLVECDHVRTRFQGGTMFAHYNSEQNWHYLSKQRPDECLFIKMFDSQSNVVQRCPHVAFKHPDSNENTLPRRSIEVRALIFTYEPGVEDNLHDD